jgi:hypothetical protein
MSNYIDFLQGPRKYSPKTLGSHQEQYHRQTTLIEVDDEMKTIIELLSKSKTFLDGVKQLKIYIQQSGGKFDYRSYFMKMNFDQAFIERVSE